MNGVDGELGEEAMGGGEIVCVLITTINIPETGQGALKGQKNSSECPKSAAPFVG
jgi:hypothetical protein